VKEWRKSKGRQIDNGKVKEVDERLRAYRELPTELREKERDRIETLMILALGDDPENELSWHCDAVMDGLMKLIASYVPSTVVEEDCKSRAEYIAAVAHADTGKRKSWFARFLKLFPGLKLEPGWRLSCLEEGDSENGFKTLFLDDGKGGFCEDIRERMRLVWDPAIATLDIVLLDYVASQFKLKRPALHKLKWLVTGLKKFLVGHGPFSPNSDDGDSLFGLFEKGVDFASLAAFDYLPRVELNADGSAVVRYMTFSPSNGFEETVMKRSAGDPQHAFRKA
jgi:hypothetical protein